MSGERSEAAPGRIRKLVAVLSGGSAVLSVRVALTGGAGSHTDNHAVSSPSITFTDQELAP